MKNMKNEKSKINVSDLHLHKMGDLEHLRSLLPKNNPICNQLDFQTGFNIFLIQNKGKGPPGRARSPERVKGIFPKHPPDFIPLRFQNPDESEHKTGRLLVLNRHNKFIQIPMIQLNDELFENRKHTEHQIIINNILNFNHTLNFLS
jgi:hypothetical protein